MKQTTKDIFDSVLFRSDLSNELDRQYKYSLYRNLTSMDESISSEKKNLDKSWKGLRATAVEMASSKSNVCPFVSIFSDY